MNENMENFTDEELLILCEGIRVLAANAEEAMRLVKSKDVHEAISQHMQKYIDLDVKVCSMMGKDLECWKV